MRSPARPRQRLITAGIHTKADRVAVTLTFQPVGLSLERETPRTPRSGSIDPLLVPSRGRERLALSTAGLANRTDAAPPRG